MLNIRFFSRVAFICNICFLLAVIMQMMKHPPQGEIVATTIIIGYVFAGALNIITNCWLLILLISQKQLSDAVPRWLIILNFLFLIPELIIFFR